jgi:polyisoprenoid-binding protein YceI
MDITSPSNRGRKRLVIAGGAIVVVAAALFAGWYFLIRDTAPAGVNTAEQAEVRDAAIAAAEAEGAEADTTVAEGAEAEGAAADTTVGIDGAWTIDTSIGTFDDFSSTFAGFRIDEELAAIGAKTVVGRTPDVSGTLQIDGTTITTTEIVVDMTTLTTDSANRNRQIKRQAIETDTFPEATFLLTSPIDLGAVPADGEPVTVTATGDLTVHGVTNSVEVPLTAELNSGVIVVVGEINLLLSDYAIDKPQAAVVLSVADNADMELQLFFTR